MIISHEHRYLFVEVPHTGSHSIASELIKFYGGERILRKHANLTQFMAQATPDERAYFIFGTVRNPLDAALTDYSKLQSNHREQFTNPAMLMANGGHVTEQHLREFDFVHNHGRSFPEFLRAFRRKVYHNWFLVGAQRFDYVLRFEQLAADYATVINLLGLELVRNLPHVNPTKKKARDFQAEYPPEIRPFVARYYGPFMRRWGYEFPESWDKLHVPLSSRVRFVVVEAVVGSAARFIKLDPDNPGINRLKRLVDAV